MSTPVAAPRTGARPKTMNGSVSLVSNPPPPPPVRKKKKKLSAPSPPGPVNSTMTSSTSSLLFVKEDISVIRPQSVMSNASSATSIRSHKKRRAPPPPQPPPPVSSPLRVTSPEDQSVSRVEDHYAVVNKSPSPLIKDDDDNYEVCESAIILSDENDDGDNHVYETVEFKPAPNVEKMESSQVTVIVIEDEEISEKKKKKKNKEGKTKKKKREIESPVLNLETKHSIQENDMKTEPARHEFDMNTRQERNMDTEPPSQERIIVTDIPRKERDIDTNPLIQEKYMVTEPPSQERKMVTELPRQERKMFTEPPSQERKMVTESPSQERKMVTEPPIQERSMVTEPPSQERKMVTEPPSKERNIDSEPPSQEQEETSKVKKVKKKKKREKSDIENVLISSQKEILNIDERQVTPVENIADEVTVPKVPELPSFRGAKAAEVHKVNESLDNEVDVIREEGQEELDQTEIENDALVDSDDELVDLFRMTTTRSGENKSVKSDSQNAVPAKQEEERDRLTMENRESDDGSEKDRNSLYLELSDEEGPTDGPKDTPKKLSGKEIEERKKMEIRQSMMTTSSNNYATLDDDDQSLIKSERLRHELKNLQIGDGEAVAGVRRRETRAVELDINIEEEESLPSLASSRASSVINLLTEDQVARNDLDRDFAVREMRKEIDVKIKTVKDDGDNEEEYTAVHEAVVVEPNDRENGTDVIVTSLHDTLIDSDDKKVDSVVPAGREMTGMAVEEGGSVKSPSPDSGIHEWGESCSSPVYTGDQSPTGTTSQLPLLALQDVEIHHDTFYKTDQSRDDLIEKVDLPKTHKLDRVLFSMSSYSDRKPDIEQSSELLRSSSAYSVLADKLNTSLAARHKPRPATNYEPPRNSVTGSGTKYANLDRPQQQTPPGPSHGQEVKQRPISRPVEARPSRLTDQATFRSRIIEEFQAKKGVLILGRSHSNSLTRGDMNGQAESLKFSSLERQPRLEGQESHYDSPRSLMVSMGVWGDQPRPSDSAPSQQLSPPPARKQSSTRTGDQLRSAQYHHQPKQIEIRYKNGKTAEVMEDPRKSVLQGSRTSKGDFAGMKEEKIEVAPSRPQLRSRKTPNSVNNQNVAEPVILGKVSDVKRKDEQAPPLFYFGQCPPSLRQELAAPSSTAVGKVRNNEALSQPFRHQPRHEPRKSSSSSSKSKSVPNPAVNSSDKIVILHSTSNNNNNNNNNNQALNQNKSKANIPMKEKKQEEVNREFQKKLLQAKSKLKSTYLGDSVERETPPAGGGEGQPPPPPPPVLPAPTLVKSVRPAARPAPARARQSNPREELMVAIRNKGGVGGLRKTGLSNL